MPRVKRGKSHIKKRKKVLKQTKGFKWGRKKLIKQAKESLKKAGEHAYRDRKKKKGIRRALWQIKISAICKDNGISYSKFMGALKKAKIELDRKILADLAENNPAIMKKIIKEVATGSKKETKESPASAKATAGADKPTEKKETPSKSTDNKSDKKAKTTPKK